MKISCLVQNVSLWRRTYGTIRLVKTRVTSCLSAWISAIATCNDKNSEPVALKAFFPCLEKCRLGNIIKDPRGSEHNCWITTGNSKVTSSEEAEVKRQKIDSGVGVPSWPSVSTKPLQKLKLYTPRTKLKTDRCSIFQPCTAELWRR